MKNNIESHMDKFTTDESPALLRLENLSKYFDASGGLLDKLLSRRSNVHAVDSINFAIKRSETVALVGESGCGKSTLGRTLIQLHQPTGGKVMFDGQDVASFSDSELKTFRQKVQMIFQNPLTSLNPRKTVGQILKAPMEIHNIKDSKQSRIEYAKEWLDRVGLQQNHIDRYPHQFSGGQQQRIAIARALILEPELLVADEPTSALDASIQAEILNLLDDLRKQLDLSLLFITHDLSTVQYIADRVCVMYLGEIIERGPTSDIFTDPQHPYTESLISAVPRIDPDARSDRIVPEGTVPSPLDPPSGCRFHTRCPKVIPPESWEGSQDQFRNVLDFRKSIIKNEYDINSVKKRLESEDRDTSEKAVADYLTEQLYSGDPAELPTNTSESIHRATRAIATNDHAKAVNAIEEMAFSPCEERTPKHIAVGDNHSAACHRRDETMSDIIQND